MKIRQRLPFILPVVFSSWIVLSLIPLFLWGGKLPVFATNILSLAFVPFLPLLPLMRTVGLATGVDAYSGPTIMGFIVGTLFYDLVLFGIGRYFSSVLPRKEIG
jgi:membrane protein DedA with SNARE-associated domain